MPARILVVDDHEVVRQGIRTILLARPDWEICGEAVNGQEAIKLADELRPDAIIMDITMPVMSGLAATSAIRAMERDQGRSHTAIISLTANALRSDIDASRDAGCDAHLSKPISKQKLLTIIEGYRTETAVY